MSLSNCTFPPSVCPLPQHASADVEKMILGNKCDVNDKRQVSKERGEKVGVVASLGLVLPGTSGQRDLRVLGFSAWRPALSCPPAFLIAC